MFEHIEQSLRAIEDDGSVITRESALQRLRNLGLGDFGEVLWEMPSVKYPKLSFLLPRMASEQVQRQWGGESGRIKLTQSLSFVRSASANYAEMARTTMHGKKILDFGCGYGRLLRVFSFYSSNIFGVDPWERSIEECHKAGLLNVALSSYLPDDLPAPKDFDFLFAFSVFTHLSENATKICLAALRRHAKDGAIACLTIRPVEYWRMIHPNIPMMENLERQHRQTGFAFRPHAPSATGTEQTYGDTSMTLEWLQTAAPGWEIAATDRSMDDIVQRYVFMRAV